MMASMKLRLHFETRFMILSINVHRHVVYRDISGNEAMLLSAKLLLAIDAK